MREILFRGKSDLLGWIEGWYCPEAKWGGHHFPVGITHKTKEGWLDDVVVIPETIGQFTGLTDKNGTKIFEGDIVRILGNQYVEDWKNVDYTALIAFIDGGFCAIDGTVEEHGFRRYALARLDFSLEVIGNIHDNPELLRGEEDG